jgi:pimeloyl-ACP methyl ester carboxylesterase
VNRSNKKGVVYGTSYGAPIAAKMAAKYPNDFYHLVMVAGAIDPDKEKFWWFHKYSRGLFVRLAMPRFIDAATDEKFAHVEELRKMLPDWDRINMPVTVMQGTDDYIVSPENLDFAREKFKNKPAHFILIQGAGHLVRRSNPDVIRNVLLKLAAR